MPEGKKASKIHRKKKLTQQTVPVHKGGKPEKEGEN